MEEAVGVKEVIISDKDFSWRRWVHGVEGDKKERARESFICDYGGGVVRSFRRGKQFQPI